MQQLRYGYRLYPSPGQCAALARAFGCARVVFNDALRARQQAHAAGLPYITDAELSARLTVAKASVERAWLSEVSSVVLQQALADLNAAYREFLRLAMSGKREGPKIAAPRLRSRKDHRPASRFTANARFKVLPGGEAATPQDRGCASAMVAAAVQRSVQRDRDQGRGRAILRQLRSGGRAPPTPADRAGRSAWTWVSPTSRCCQMAARSILRGCCGGQRRSLSGPSGCLSRKQTAAATGPEPGSRWPARMPGRPMQAATSPPAVHSADPREPSGRRGRPGGRVSPAPAWPRSVHDAGWSAVRGDAGVQGPRCTGASHPY